MKEKIGIENHHKQTEKKKTKTNYVKKKMEKEMGTLNRSKQIKKKYSTQDLLTMKKKKKIIGKASNKHK